MAKQLNILTTGQVIPTALHQEMERSYLEYAMSVIVGRALPDVRDGLKPVHRRILYAMHELGLIPERPFRKCARVVGDVLGKYHPHGDQAVYEALARMVQDFSTRYPLLSGHGNFGSIDNDPPAAMRYTETRLAAIGDQAMLGGISEAIVNFTNNFDNSQQEPVILPAQLPFLLLNGCTGIAVGMATNIPPHNLGEVVDGLIALIDNPTLADEALWDIIPGPDFPTGGEIIELEGIREAYRTGKGIIPVKGVTTIETVSLEKQRRRKERTAIIVTELPYQVNKSSWIEKVAELVNQGRIEGIADIRDESDRQGMRVVIELKREAEPKKILNALYNQTALKTNFGAILLALVNNQPCQLSLRQLLEEFLAFREQTLIRQYTDELEQAQQRLHLVEGLLIALKHLDRVIDILRNAADGSTAKLKFQEALDISEGQADTILAMPLRRLTGLEQQKLQTEHDELQGKIQELQTLLNNRHEFLKALKKELRTLKRKFADRRRTKIITRSTSAKVAATSKETLSSKPTEEKSKTSLKASEKKPKASQPTSEPSVLTLFTPQTPPDDALLTVTCKGDIYWQSNKESKSQENLIIYTETIQKRQKYILILDNGKAYSIPIQDVPPSETQATPLMSLVSKTAQKEAETAVGSFFYPEDESLDLILLTGQGRIKRLPSSELQEIGNRGLSLIKLKESDRLNYLCWHKNNQEIAIATSGGRILRFQVTDEQIPIMGRNAQGNPALRLRYGEQIIGCVTVNSQENLLLVSGFGYGKRLPVNLLRITQLGEIGTQGLQFASKTDSLVGMIEAKPKGDIILLTNQQRRVPLSVESAPIGGKDGTGDRLVRLKPEESIVKIYPLITQ